MGRTRPGVAHYPPSCRSTRRFALLFFFACRYVLCLACHVGSSSISFFSFNLPTCNWVLVSSRSTHHSRSFLSRPVSFSYNPPSPLLCFHVRTSSLPPRDTSFLSRFRFLLGPLLYGRSGFALRACTLPSSFPFSTQSLSSSVLTIIRPPLVLHSRQRGGRCRKETTPVQATSRSGRSAARQRRHATRDSRDGPFFLAHSARRGPIVLLGKTP